MVEETPRRAAAEERASEAQAVRDQASRERTTAERGGHDYADDAADGSPGGPTAGPADGPVSDDRAEEDPAEDDPAEEDPSGGSAPEEASLFPNDALPDELVGYRGPAACQIAGITYRQLDYWARTKLVRPSIRSATGSGSQRLYSFKDLLVLKVVKRLLDTGVSLHNIRTAVDHLRNRGVRDLAGITLFSDGTTVYECTSAEEVVDLLQGGQGVFGIAVSGAMREISGTIHEFTAEPADGVGRPEVVEDELSRRRRDRHIG